MLTFERIRELRAQREQLVREMEALLKKAEAEKRDLTAAERADWEEYQQRINELTNEIGELERRLGGYEFGAYKAVYERTESVRGLELYRRAWRAWIAGDDDALGPDEREALRQGLERRALGIGTPSAGGYLVPETMQRQIERRLAEISPVINLVTRIRTTSGEDLMIPTVDDTANSATIVSENTALAEQDVSFGQIKIGAYTYSTGIVRISLQLMQDSAFDLEAFLAEVFADRLARALQDHITSGDGTTQPEGILTAIPSGQIVQGATGQTTSVTYDDLVDLVHKVDPAYRSSQRAAFMMHDATAAALKKLKDSNGRPLWQDGLQAGEPARLLGYRVIVCNAMPPMAAGAKSIIFGDFSKYVLREVGSGLVVRRLDERYAEYLQTAVLGFARYDGRVLQPYAFACYQNSAA